MVPHNWRTEPGLLLQTGSAKQPAKAPISQGRHGAIALSINTARFRTSTRLRHGRGGRDQRWQRAASLISLKPEPPPLSLPAEDSQLLPEDSQLLPKKTWSRLRLAAQDASSFAADGFGHI